MTAQDLEDIAKEACERNVRIVMHPDGFFMIVSFDEATGIIRNEHRKVPYIEATLSVDPVGIFRHHMKEMGA